MSVKCQERTSKILFDHLIGAGQAAVCGISMPSVFAIFKLIDQLEFGRLSTGKSAGPAPLRIRST